MVLSSFDYRKQQVLILHINKYFLHFFTVKVITCIISKTSYFYILLFTSKVYFEVSIKKYIYDSIRPRILLFTSNGQFKVGIQFNSIRLTIFVQIYRQCQINQLTRLLLNIVSHRRFDDRRFNYLLATR